MDPALSASLLKAAARLSSGPIRRQLSRRTLRLRISWGVAREARRRGIDISWRALRGWLARSDVQEQLRLGSAATVASAVEQLAWLLPGTQEDRKRDAQTVLFLVLEKYLRVQDPATATAVAHDWQVEHTKSEGRIIRDTVHSMGESILERLSMSHLFGEQVRSLHPWRRALALEIRDSWPTIEAVVRAISEADDRGVLLQQWAEQPPDWYLDAPAEVACWLGQLASDYQRQQAAAVFIGAGLDRGAFPADYWQARRAMLLAEADPEAARELLETTAESHPLAGCLGAWLREEWQEAIEAVFAWKPEHDADRAMRLQILARLTAGSGDLNTAVSLAMQAAEIEGATGAALLAGELLLSRARYGETVDRLADAEQALALALRARNARRAWNGDHVAAALVAIKAAALTGNHRRAWELTQPSPHGEATQEEATDARLQREAALLAALTERFEQAREAAGAVDDPFVNAEIEALELTAQGNTVEAVQAWQKALSLTEDDVHILRASMSLAELGAPLPDLTALEDDHPETVREIRLVQQAMVGDGDELERLRAGATESVLLTIKLAEVHGERGEHGLAGDVLKAGAERWADPRLMLMAARQYRKAGDLESARHTAESSLALGGPSWAGTFDARAFLFEVYDATGDWERATEQARALVTLDPHDPEARWALVHSLARRGELRAAWNALTPEGVPIPPRNPHDAYAWIHLTARHDTSAEFVTRALQTMRRFPDDEELQGVFIGQLYTGLRREELTPTDRDLEALHAATADYTERFPDSTVFRSVSVSTEDPLASLSEDLRQQHEALEDVSAQVRDGKLPLGMLAQAAGRSYAEASIRRAAGFVRCHDPAREAQGHETVRAVLDQPVVLDTTAAHTLALIDSETRSQLRAAFAQVVATDPTYRDALRGQESLGLRSTMSTGWDPVGQRPTVDIMDESEAEELAVRAERLCNILRAAVRRPWPELRSLRDLPFDSDWLSSLDMAATDGIALWCDDAVLRSLATNLDVQTFDTVDLLRHLVDTGRLDRDVLTVTTATLYRNYYADLGFDRAALDLAATMDGWKPQGAAFAITRPAAWTDPARVVEFALAAVGRPGDVPLDQLEGWITAANVGLVRVAPDQQAAGANLRIFLAQCLTQPWMRPDRLPTVLSAVRAAQSERPGTPDPLETVLEQAYNSLVAEHGHGQAASLLMSLMQFAAEQDRRAACRVVLTH